MFGLYRNQVRLIALLSCVLLATLAAFAQRGGERPSRGGRRQAVSRDEYPMWTIDDDFKHDVFTFVRIQYDGYGGRGRGGGWSNDHPDCDWNFSARLHELTSMQVDPHGKVFRLPAWYQHRDVRDDALA
jgi:hypothetical protein